MVNSRTPREAELLREAIFNVLTQVHTSMPGEVVSYDADERTASIQPSLKTKTKGEGVRSRPQVTRAPVLFLTGGGFSSTVPLEPGDSGSLFFSERSLDRWFKRGGEVDPKSGRKFKLSDGFFVPGLLPKPGAPAARTDGAWFGKSDQSSGLLVKSDGSVSLGTSTADVVTLLNDTASALKSTIITLQTAVTATMLGPQPLDAATLSALSTAQANIDAVISKLSSIKT